MNSCGPSFLFFGNIPQEFWKVQFWAHADNALRKGWARGKSITSPRTNSKPDFSEVFFWGGGGVTRAHWKKHKEHGPNVFIQRVRKIFSAWSEAAAWEVLLVSNSLTGPAQRWIICACFGLIRLDVLMTILQRVNQLHTVRIKQLDSGYLQIKCYYGGTDAFSMFIWIQL